MLSAAREVVDMLKGFSAEKFQTERVVMRATERCIAQASPTCKALKDIAKLTDAIWSREPRK
jgi:hypothetical protein